MDGRGTGVRRVVESSIREGTGGDGRGRKGTGEDGKGRERAEKNGRRGEWTGEGREFVESYRVWFQFQVQLRFPF